MRRLHGCVRVLALAATLLAIAGAVVARRAEARFAEVLRGFGQQLTQLHELSAHSVPRRLFVNGLELGVVSASTKLPVSEALSRFQTLCHGVKDVDVPSALKQELDAPGMHDPLNQGGVVRKETEHEGFVACLDTGERLTGEGLLGRLQEFSRTRDLQSLGALHYAFARRSGELTTLVMFWTEGEAKLEDLFKEGQDAPGRDLFEVPRPGKSKRVLSAFEQGQPYGLALYRVTGQSLVAASGTYAVLLREGGWHVQAGQEGVLRATKVGRGLFVRMRKGRSGDVLVSVLDVG